MQQQSLVRFTLETTRCAHDLQQRKLLWPINSTNWSTFRWFANHISFSKRSLNNKGKGMPGCHVLDRSCPSFATGWKTLPMPKTLLTGWTFFLHLVLLQSRVLSQASYQSHPAILIIPEWKLSLTKHLKASGKLLWFANHDSTIMTRLWLKKSNDTFLMIVDSRWLPLQTVPTSQSTFGS